jgi:hypothetical protein
MISTQGKTLVQIGVYCDTTTKKIYSAFTHTAPCFVPDPADATGTAPTRTGQVTLTALTTNAAIAILQAQRTNFFGSGKYLDYMKNRQIMPGTPGAPPEVIGLDINTTSVASWMSANSNATYTDWRNHEGTLSMGPGYSMFPDELVSVLTTAFLMPPFTNASGSVVWPGYLSRHQSGLPRGVGAGRRVVFAMRGRGLWPEWLRHLGMEGTVFDAAYCYQCLAGHHCPQRLVGAFPGRCGLAGTRLCNHQHHERSSRRAGVHKLSGAIN